MPGKSFSVRISLDGGADIKKQLQDIGAAGKKAFSELEQASRGNSFAERLGTSVKEAATKLGTLGKSLGEVGNAATEFGSKIGGSINKIAALGGLSIAGAVAGFIGLTKAAGEAGEQLKNTADALGITGQKLKNLRDSFGLAGIDEGTFDRAMLKLSNGMADAGKSAITYQRNLRDLRQSYNDGEISSDAYEKAVKKLKQANEDSLDPFTRLGIAVKNADGSLRKTDDVLEDVADVFHEMPDGAEKAGLAIDLFGAKNSRLIGKLNEGRAAMIAANKEAQRLAPTLDKASGESLQQASDSFDQLGKTIASVKNSILATFSPQVTELVMAFVEAIVRNRTDLTLFASTIADKVKPVVKDLVALLEGRDSDVKNQSILKAKQSMLDFAAATKKAIFGIIIPAFGAFLATLDVIVKAINAVFGTDLTAGQIAIVGVVLRLTGLFGVLTSGARLAYVAIGALVTAFGGIPVAIAAAGFAVGYLLVNLVTDWEGTTKKIGELWDTLWSLLPSGAQEALSAIAAPFLEFGRIVGRIVSGIAISFASLFNGEFASNLGVIFDAAWEAIRVGAATLWQWLVDGFETVFNTIAALPETISTVFGLGWETIKQGASDVGQWIMDRFNDVVAFFQSIPDLIASAMQSGWDAVKQGVQNVATWIVAKFKNAVDTVKKFLKSIAQDIGFVGGGESGGGESGGGGDNAPGFAGGGYIRGAGTGTSDSIHALVSNGEYIFTAKAVKRLGLSFLNALNYGRDIGNAFRSFSFGGIVSALTPPVPRYASGGLVSVPAVGSGGSGHPVELHFESRVVKGLTATPDAVIELQRFAIRSRIISAGKAPPWKGA